MSLIRDLAQYGRDLRVRQLREELTTLESLTFTPTGTTTIKNTKGTNPTRTAGGWTPAMRAAVSKRMKRYWKTQRNGK